MAEAVKLFLKFQDHPLYPQAREFSDYEAFLDLLLKAHPQGVVERSLQDLADDWHWNRSRVNRFLDQLQNQRLLQRDNDGNWKVAKSELWYDLEPAKAKVNRDNAQRVVDAFNRVFGKNVILNDYRARTICARISEGQKQEPAIAIADFVSVFEYKKREWGDSDETRKWLTIETLCARKHFQKYREQAQSKPAAAGASSRIQGSIMNKT